MIHYLGLDDCDFQDGNGFYGYFKRKWFSGISIHYDNPTVPGVLVEMSGTGCRAFETFAVQNFNDFVHSSWGEIFGDIISNDNFVITRLDVAFDDRSGWLDLKRLIHDFRHENFVTRFKTGKDKNGKQSRSCLIEMASGDKAPTLYFGSAQSEIRFRIYDKSAERGYDEDVHWVRLEMVLRRDMALSFLQELTKQEYDFGGLFSAVLLNYLRFVVPPKHGNETRKRRWAMARYWEQLTGDVLPKSLWRAKDLEYNKERCENYVYRQAGNSIAALIQLDGLEKFAENLTERKSRKVPERIRQMIAEETASKNGDAILDAIHGT